MTLALRDWRNWAALLASGLVIAALLGAVEALLPAADRGGHAVEISGRYTRASDTMGWEPIPSLTARSKKVRGNEVLYDVSYAFDSAGRRIAPEEAGPTPTRFLVFFGGSNTFGEGLSAEQTLPYQTALHLPGVRAYNYGYRGYGPQHLLAKLESRNLREEIAEPEGLAVYVLPGFHLHRLVGSSRTLSWVDQLPYYREEEGQLVREGFFQTARPRYSWLMKKIGTSRLLRRLGIAWPLRFTEADRELACRLFAQAREALRGQFSKIDLVVALHPTGLEQDWRCFEAVGVRTVNLRPAYVDIPEAEFTIPGDGHVNARGNRLLGEVLASGLEPLLVEDD